MERVALGLGLWNSVAGTMVVEVLMLAARLWLYVRTSRAVDRIGRYAFVANVGLLMWILQRRRRIVVPANRGGVA